MKQNKLKINFLIFSYRQHRASMVPVKSPDSIVMALAYLWKRKVNYLNKPVGCKFHFTSHHYGVERDFLSLHWQFHFYISNWSSFGGFEKFSEHAKKVFKWHQVYSEVKGLTWKQKLQRFMHFVRVFKNVYHLKLEVVQTSGHLKDTVQFRSCTADKPSPG